MCPIQHTISSARNETGRLREVAAFPRLSKKFMEKCSNFEMTEACMGYIVHVYYGWLVSACLDVCVGFLFASF